MIPGRALLILGVVPVALSLMVTVYPDLLWPLLALDVMVVMLAILDAFTAFGRVEVQRECKSLQAVGRSFPVSLTVQNVGARALTVRVQDDAPGETGDEMPLSLTLPRHASHRLTYALSVNRRGHHRFADAGLRRNSRRPCRHWRNQGTGHLA